MCGYCLFTACNACFLGEQRKGRTLCFDCNDPSSGDMSYRQFYQIRQRLFLEYFNLEELKILNADQHDHDKQRAELYKKEFRDWQNKRAEEIRKQEELEV